MSPLGASLNGGHLKVAQLPLYELDADVDVRGCDNRTPLINASCSGHLEIIQWLLSRSAKLTARDEEDGLTPQPSIRIHDDLYMLSVPDHSKNPSLDRAIRFTAQSPVVV